jgi:hypothetical protein
MFGNMRERSMNSKRHGRQFARFKINGLIAFFLGAIMIASVIGLGILLWYELTDPERLEPQRAHVPGICRFSKTDPTAVPWQQLATSRSLNGIASRL